VSASTGFVPQSASRPRIVNWRYFRSRRKPSNWSGVTARTGLQNKLNVNIAAYRIIRWKHPSEDPDDSDLLVSVGKVRSQGIEIDVMADITPRWVGEHQLRLQRHHSKKKRQMASNTLMAIDSPIHRIDQLGLWTRYDFPSITSSIAFGADYVSDQINRQGQTIKPLRRVRMRSWQTSWEGLGNSS